MNKKIIASLVCALLIGTSTVTPALATTQTTATKKVETKANSDKKVNEEVDKVIKAIDSVTSSKQNVEVKFTKKDDGSQIFWLGGTSAFVYEKGNELFKDASVYSSTTKPGETFEDKDIVIFKGDLYTKKDKKFVKVGKAEITDPDAFDTYRNLIKPLTQFPDKFKMEKSGEDLVFTFKGVDKEIFDIVKKPYSIKVENADESKFEQDIKFTLDAKTSMLKKVEISVETQMGITINEVVDLTLNMFEEITDPLQFQ